MGDRRIQLASPLRATRLLVFFSFAFVVVAAAQQSQSSSPQTREHVPAMRATARLVQVNVIVNDKHGNPITGLAKEDFLLSDNKKRQEIQFFSEENNRPPDRPATLPPDTFTNRIGEDAGTPESVTVILLDALNTEFADRALAQKQVVKFLQQIQPHDHVALYWLGNRLHVLHDFTSDVSILRETLAGFGGESSHELADSKAVDPSLNNPNSSAPGGQTSSREAFRQAFAQRAANESTKDRVRLTVAALIAIAHHAGALKGRKNLVWVSGSFPFSLGNEKFDLDWANDTGASFLGEIEKAARALTDANIAVYPVDARGLMGGDINATQDSSDEHPEFSSEGDEHLPTHVVAGNLETMKTLADRTGGKAFYGTNDLSGSIRRAIDDSRETYTLAYLPAGVNWDGSFHRIKVEVKIKGAEVRARAGYFAIPDSAKAPRKTEEESIALAAQSPLAATQIGVRVQVEAKKDADARTLSASIRLDLKEIHLEQGNGLWTGAIQMVFLQLNKKGEIVHAGDKTFQLSLQPAIYEQTLKNGIRQTELIQIAPQAAQLCIVVRDPSNNNLGSITIPIAKYFSTGPVGNK